VDLDKLWRGREVQEGVDGVGWRLAEEHGGFVAGVAAGAVLAVLLYFVADGEAVGDVEVEVFEEGGDAGEEADGGDVTALGLLQEGLDEKATGAVAFDVWEDDDGADLGEVRAVDMEGCTAEELVSVGFDDSEGGDVTADLGVGAVQEGAVVGEAVDEVIDGGGVTGLSWPRVHGGEGRRGRRFRYEGQGGHMSLRFSLGLRLGRVRLGRAVGLAAVVAAFGLGLPGDGREGALEEGVVDDVALVVFAFDDPVAGEGFALAGVGEDNGRVAALGGVDEERSAGAKRVHGALSGWLCGANDSYLNTSLVKEA
jgi:hypothetical protein